MALATTIPEDGTLDTVYLDGAFVPRQDAKISIFDRAVLFADAVYEVFAVLDGHIVDLEWHLMRLARSMAEMRIRHDVAAAGWDEILRQLVEKNALLEGAIYLQVSRGAAPDRDFLFPGPDVVPTVFAFCQSRPLVRNPLAERGMRVITRADQRWARRDIKTVQLLFASMMKMEAQAAGVDDIWFTDSGMVTEGTSQNVAIITKAGHVVTHPQSHAILPGVTRLGMIEIARAGHMTVEERPFTVGEAQGAAEAFVTSATMLVVPVVEIDGLAIGDGRPGLQTLALRTAYIARARENTR